MEKRPKRRRTRKVVNKLAVREGREAGKSYAKIAAELGISPSGAFYADNPRKRKRSVTRVDGLARSIWISLMTDWEGVQSAGAEGEDHLIGESSFGVCFEGGSRRRPGGWRMTTMALRCCWSVDRDTEV